jgi:hypothetical protein
MAARRAMALLLYPPPDDVAHAAVAAAVAPIIQVDRKARTHRSPPPAAAFHRLATNSALFRHRHAARDAERCSAVRAHKQPLIAATGRGPFVLRGALLFVLLRFPGRHGPIMGACPAKVKSYPGGP